MFDDKIIELLKNVSCDDPFFIECKRKWITWFEWFVYFEKQVSSKVEYLNTLFKELQNKDWDEFIEYVQKKRVWLMKEDYMSNKHLYTEFQMADGSIARTRTSWKSFCFNKVK